MKSTFGSRLALASLLIAAAFLVRVEARPQAQKMTEEDSSWTDYSEEADIDSLEPESSDLPAYLPGKNVSREEYVRAYTVYMANVRNRREESRGGYRSAAERRKKAQILLHTLYPSETRMADMADAGVTLVTLAFDIKPVQLSDGIRVKEAKLYAPQGCVIGKSEESKWADGGFKVGQRLTKSFASKATKMEFSVSCPEKALASTSFKLDVVLLDMMGDDRLKREVRHNNKDKKLRFSDFAESDDPAVRKQRYSRLGKRHSKDCHEGKGGCCRKSWKVNLEDLKIHNDEGMVFMLPREVDLHQCDGKCSGKHVPYASNHAIFRKMFAKSKEVPMGEVGKLCCVPTKFEDLDVIQFDPVTSTLKNTVIHNAIVKECGCI